ncbi:MAG TPA: TolC family protein, partial [Ferruginibacter sp.]|nr:TolC family protein [Ferruginibacter sp.]
MRYLIILMILLLPSVLQAQNTQHLSVQEAYDLSRQNYPAIKRKDLIRQTATITIENLQKGFLPQVNLSSQATYQSDVTKFPINLPGLNIEAPSKDQYKILADVNQLVYDGGLIKTEKELQGLTATVEEQKLEVELYQVRERIDQLFLGVLLLEQQEAQVNLVSSDIRSGIKRVEAQVQNGVSFRSNLDLLKAELLKIQQRSIELNATRKGLIDALSLYIGKDLPPDVRLERPAVEWNVSAISRPEIKLFEQQTVLISNQDKLIHARNLPRASLFAQGGYGKPGLNFLKN